MTGQNTKKAAEKWTALLGNPETKRTIYFEHAARTEGLHILFMDWREWEEGTWEKWLLKNDLPGMIKIDPPLWHSASLAEGDKLAEGYQRTLKTLSDLRKKAPVSFFNDPEEISVLLDKRRCKEKLIREGILVTEEVAGVRSGERLTCAEELLTLMRDRRIVQVFIKPVNGSGAAGVCAFRFQPKTGKMALYTCAAEDKICGRLVNTRRLVKRTDPEEIGSFFDKLFTMDCIAEYWYAKAEHQGFCYDLRVIIQDGETDFLLARLSKGPITNLHISNHPLPVSMLGLPRKVLDAVEELGQKAVRCFPKMRSVGLDILLEKGSLTPRIIEMNGQGDLIYQDIYGENRIYRHQARMIKAWLEE